jgi:iron complex outermembrane recepter protein
MFIRTKVSTAAVVAVGAAAALIGPASAQEAQRIEITGSAIKRVDAETALPVTIINTEDLARQGVTTVEQALQRLASNQSNFGSSSSIGGTTGGKAEADLRGLSGPLGTNANKTLVLLNGRRLANHAFDAAAVDLNAIPLAAVSRVEVLRDGASALYGTDAIGGVINFVLKRDFKGVEISAEAQRPETSFAGSVGRANVAVGFGSLATDRFSVLATLDTRSQKVMAAVDRKFGSTGILGTTRGAITSGTSGTAFPGDVGGFEPSGPNCDPPFSVPRFSGADNTGTFEACRYDFTRSIDLIPENKQVTGLIRASFAVAPNNTLSAEYLRANNKQTSRVAPAPTSGLISVDSPFFPAGATSRDLTAGPVNLLDALGITYTPGQSTGNAVNWRQVPAGKRTSGDDTTTQRLLLDLEGSAGSIDYRAAVGRSQNKSTASVKRGYVNDSLIAQGVWDGVINPFGTHRDPTFGQTAAGTAAIAAAQVVADTQIGKNTVDFAEARASMDLFNAPGGMSAIAFGVEHRRESSAFEATPITAQLGSLGIDSESDTSGKRNSSAVFAELNVPLMKKLDLTLAARYDKYSDFGSTFNPKVALRFQPIDQVVLRGSYNSGFRAPTLYEIYQPNSLTFTTDNYDDPLLCPGGEAVAGTSAGVVCGQQVLQRTGGPVGTGGKASDLKPEKSKSFSLGAVLQPTSDLSFTFDFWQLKISDLINSLPEQTIFGDQTKYSSRFVRCSAVAAGAVPGVALRDADACANLTATQDPIAFIATPVENLGKIKVRGVDLSGNFRVPTQSLGSFSLGLDGTYITKYAYQRERGGEFVNAVARYTDNAPVFRWQHVASVRWTVGDWSTNLSQRFKSGYLDQNETSKVGSYSIFDASLTWTGVKNLTLTAGIVNLLDDDPPRSVQSTTFQRGYDPRFTDPLGRTYTVRAAYKF